MNVRKILTITLPFLVGFGMLIASQSDEDDQSSGGLDYSVPGWSGRSMTPAESTTTARAIDSIGTPPPASITWTDAAGSTNTVSCTTFANLLREQQSGDSTMEVETEAGASGVVNDGEETTDGDRMNVDSTLIAWATADPDDLVYLEETLIHEAVHKWQKTNEMTNDEREIDALEAELAYKDSCGLTAANWFYRFKLNLLINHWINHIATELEKRESELKQANNHKVFLQHDPYGTNVDYFSSNATSWWEEPLPIRASDLLVYDNYPYFPPGHSLGLIFGWDPMSALANVMAVDIFEGQIFGAQFHQYPPPFRFLYSATQFEDGGLFYVSDTMNNEIVTMMDWNGDWIPDEITSVYASASWPGFEPLEEMRGVTAVDHLTRTVGIRVTDGEIHESHLTNPYDPCWFLPDLDGDNVADACVPSFMYEFLSVPPVIQHPFPWIGEDFVQLFATWNNSIDVWATDSMGTVFYEPAPLGTVLMAGGPDAECILNRPLVAGEFVLPIDITTGERPRRATKVVDPTPQHLTIQYLPTGELHLQWEEVTGADQYLLYGSEDGEVFFNTGLIAVENEFYMALPLNVDKYFYRITAER